jgi:phosphohistidine phosphatase
VTDDETPQDETNAGDPRSEQQADEPATEEPATEEPATEEPAGSEEPGATDPTMRAVDDRWVEDAPYQRTAPTADPEPGTWIPDPSLDGREERHFDGPTDEPSSDDPASAGWSDAEPRAGDSAADGEPTAPTPGTEESAGDEPGAQPHGAERPEAEEAAPEESPAGERSTGLSPADPWTPETSGGSSGEPSANAAEEPAAGERSAEEPAANTWSTEEPPAPAPPSRRSGPRIELYLLRHADAGDPMAWRGPDEDRPLSERGRKQAARLGKFLERSGFEGDVMLTSPKLRAVETARLVAKRLGLKPKTDERLAYAVGIRTVEDILDSMPDARRVVLVGHDPDFTELLAVLTESWIPIKKGAIVRIDTVRPLAPGSGELRWLIPPEAVKAAEKRGADADK